MSNQEILEVTPVEGWKKADQEALLVRLPSKKVVRLKIPEGLEAFLKGGVIPNSLMGFVTERLEEAQGKKPKAKPKTDDPADPLAGVDAEAMQMMKDPTKVADILTLVDNVTIEYVVEPRIHPVPSPEDLDENAGKEGFDSKGRRLDRVYVDEVELEDRFFIFNYAVGGTQDLERFHGELAGSVDAVRDVAAKPKPTKRTGAPKGKKR